MEIADYKLQKMLTAAAELGAINALKKAGIMQKDELSQREAFRRFGEANVRRWRLMGKLKRIKLGDRNAKVTYSLTELETISQSEKL
ncbi:MAG: hypothetical protein KG029_07780 [Bacteroidetes bacterium]|nr:hypothetical protein [Bacteroidota bacterium]